MAAPNDSPVTSEPESANKAAGNTPIALGPPPPAPTPRQTAASDNTAPGPPKPSETAPLYSVDEKPQLYDGYGY